MNESMTTVGTVIINKYHLLHGNYTVSFVMGTAHEQHSYKK